MISYELKPGFVLKDHLYDFGYAILTNVIKGGKIHLTTLYNEFDCIGEDCENLEDLVARISLGEYSIIEDKDFNKIKKMIEKSPQINNIGLPKDVKFYNRLSSLYRND